MIDFVEYYYTQICGEYPGTDDAYKKQTQKVIDYLIEANVPNYLIIKFLDECPQENFITVDMLPDWLWDNSLLKRDTFYYSSILNITSKAPSWSPLKESKRDKFSLEMKIIFTENDLLEYFYKSFEIEEDLKDEKRDLGSLKFLFSKCNKLDFIEPIDFIICLINFGVCMKDETKVNNLLDLQQFTGEVYEKLKAMIAEAEVSKMNKIVWR